MPPRELSLAVLCVPESTSSLAWRRSLLAKRPAYHIQTMAPSVGVLLSNRLSPGSMPDALTALAHPVPGLDLDLRPSVLGFS